jgi:DNA-binding beta-propeller fold protein YncE
MRRSALLLAGSAFSLVLGMSTSWAKPPSSTFGIQKTIQVPNGLKAFDISFCDDASQLCFVADQTNKAIDIINARDDSILDQFVPTTDGGFVGAGSSNFDLHGPDGVLEAHNLHQLWVGDGKSRVWVIDVKDPLSPSVVDVISTALPSNPSDAFRADELSYDPKDKMILIANPGDTPPFISLISTTTHKVLRHIIFDTANGLEQSVFDNRTGLFYLAVPEANGPGTGEVVAIDPDTLSLVSPPVADTGDCSENGMALNNTRQQLLLGCSIQKSLILDLRSGGLTTITETGGSDEVWFDPHDKTYYLADLLFKSGGAFAPNIGVINGRTNTFVTNVFDGSNNPFTTLMHSIAANAANNHVYVPLAANTLQFDNDASKGLKCDNGCIGVFFFDK